MRWLVESSFKFSWPSNLKDVSGRSPGYKTRAGIYNRNLQPTQKHLDNNEYLLSGGFGLADILLMSCLDWAIFYEFELSKNITIYREKIIKRTAFIKAMEVNY